jgi:GntR family transcriptional regulator
MEKPALKSQKLFDALAALIGKLETGDRLPSEPQLARQLQVSRATLREAMRTFESQGLIHRRQGAGTYVARPTQVIEYGLEVLESLDTLAQRIGLALSVEQVTVDTRPAAEVEKARLTLPDGAEVCAVSRVILADNQPAAFLVDILPVHLLDPALLDEEFNGSVLDILLRKGSGSSAPEISRSDISAVTAPLDIARALHIQRGDVLLCFEALLYDRSGRPMDYSLSYFLPGHFRFHVVRRVGMLESVLNH